MKLILIFTIILFVGIAICGALSTHHLLQDSSEDPFDSVPKHPPIILQVTNACIFIFIILALLQCKSIQKYTVAQLAEPPQPAKGVDAEDVEDIAAPSTFSAIKHLPVLALVLSSICCIAVSSSSLHYMYYEEEGQEFCTGLRSAKATKLRAWISYSTFAVSLLLIILIIWSIQRMQLK